MSTISVPTLRSRSSAISIIRILPWAKSWFHLYRYLVKSFGPKRWGETYFGARLECDLNQSVSWQIFFFGFWEPNISALIESRLGPGDLFIDVGANIGYYTLLASRIVGPAGKVIAIEPSTSIRTRLHKNVAANGAINVRILPVALSSTEGTISLYADSWRNPGGTSTIPQEGATPIEVVKSSPLDQLLSADELLKVKLIKMDIEGGEVSVLRRFILTLELYHENIEVLVEMNPTDENRKELSDIFRALLENGFEAFAIENQYDEKWYLTWSAPVSPVRIERLPYVQTDVLFSRMRSTTN